MKRKEEIENAAHQKYPYVGGTKGMICENSIPIFIQGAEWADKTMIDKAAEVFSEMLIELCPDLLGFGGIAKKWENEFRKRLEE